MIRRVKKRFDLDVGQDGAKVSKTFELDKTIVKIKGLLFTSDRDDLIYFRGSQRVEINNQEYFPEKYESKLLMTGLGVQPNMKYYRLGSIEPGNGLIKVEFQDSASGMAAFAPYRVSLYVDCEMEDSLNA